MIGEFIHGLSAVFVIFCIMAVGFGLGQLGWIRSQEKRFITRFILNIGIPMNTVVGVMKNLRRDELSQMGVYLLVPFITILLTLFLSMAAAHFLRLPHRQQGVFIVLAFLSNTLFIGLPMSEQLFGDAGTPYVILYYVVSTTFTQTVAILLMERAGTKEEELLAAAQRSLPARVADLLKNVLSKPPILAILACVVLVLLNVRLPDVMLSFAGYLGSTASPLGLIYCGVVMWEIGVKNIRLSRGMPLVLVIRLAIAPAICIAVCAILGVQGLPRDVFAMEAGLASLTQAAVLAGEYGADEQYAALGCTLTTLGTFVTIPILMVILSGI